MAVYLRGKTWWYSFSFAGRRVQESAKTNSKSLARRAEQKRHRDLEEGFNCVTDQRHGRVRTITDLANDYLESYLLRHPSDRFARYAIGNVVRHLGSIMSVDVMEHTVVRYQSSRLKENVSPKSINEEVGFLLRVLGDAGELIRVRLRKTKALKLKIIADVGKPWSPEEIARLLAEARHRRSPTFYVALCLSLNTGMRLTEVRTLRWGRVDLLKRYLVVEKAKTRAGTGRTVPISDEAYDALIEHAKWFRGRFGEIAPDLFVFPFGRPLPNDPTRPVTSFKTAWGKTRKAAGVEGRWHDARHTFITELAESGVGEQVIKDTVGHVSDHVLRHYTHIRIEAKRDAVEDAMHRRHKSTRVSFPGETSTDSTTVEQVN